MKLKLLFTFLLLVLLQTIGFGQSCNVVKTGEFTGSISSDWTVTNTGIAGWYSPTWTPGVNEAYIDADGTTSTLKQNVTGLINGPLTLTFKIRGQNANRSNGNTTATLVVKLNGTTYLKVTNIVNNTQILASNVIPSNFATVAVSGFPLTVGSASAGLAASAINQGSITVTIPWTTPTTTALATGDLEFVATTSPAGDDWFLDDINLLPNSNPTVYDVNGISICSGGTATIGLNDSQIGAKYQLLRNGVNVGNVVDGTGNAISSIAFGNQTVAGTYTVTTIVGSANCKLMNGSVLISALPTVSNAGPDISNCNLSSFTLSGNSPATGTGLWSVVSGTASITTPSSNTSEVTGITAGNSATLRWTISNGTCTASTDDVVLTNNSLPNNTSDGFKATIMCAGDRPQLIFDAADDETFSATYSIKYQNNAIPPVQYTQAIDTSSPFSFKPGDNSTANMGYTLISISNGTCTRTASFGKDSANLIVRPIPTAGISGTTTVCQGSSIPNITFTNPQSVAITVTYTINGGGDQTINVPANVSKNLPVTATSGSSLYELKNVVYQGAATCPNTISGSATVTVNPTPTLTDATQTIFACDNPSSKAKIELKGLLGGSTSTINYSIDGNAQNPITNVDADATGNAVFWTRDLTTADKDKLLQITGITITSATPSCTKSFAGNVDAGLMLKVQSNSGSIKLERNVILSSTTFSELSSAHFSIDPIAGTVEYNWVVPASWTITAGDKTNEITVMTGRYTDPDITVSVTASNSFCPSSVTIALTSIAPDAPVPTVVIPVKCTTLGSVSFDNLPATSWTLKVIKDGVISSIDGLGNTYTVGSLTAGDYTFTVKDDYGVSAASSTVTIDEVTKTWNGSGWFKGVDPTIDPTKNDLVVFAGNYSEPDSVEACSCRVNSGVDVTIASGKVLTVVNDLNIQGTLTFKNGASLIQEDASIVNTNNSNIVYERTSSEVVDFDYVYWSSPVKGQTLEDLSPQSDKYWSWVGDYWLKANGQMEAGTGYIARVPRYTSFQTVKFKGAPNNGTITTPTQGAHKNNLIGNPYPSAIDAEQFMADNIDVYEGMLYFWTHNTERKPSADGTQYVYNPEDYVPYNGVGTVEAWAGAPVPDGNIPAGQSFMVVSEIKDFFRFTNDMRIGDEGKNGLFLKQSNRKKKAKVEKNRIWLNLTNSDGAFKQLLLGYVAGATNDLDKLFDGTSFGSPLIDFYSVINSKKYTIQGRGLPFDEKDEVPLGYKTNVDGTFQINIDKVDGSLVNQAIYLEDKVTNTVHDLKKGSYSFTTAKGEFQDRFVLRYTNTVKLGTEDFDSKGKGVVVSVKNSQIKVNSFDETLSSVKVYDLKGSLLYEKDKLDKNEFTIDHLASSNQFMIVMVQLENGKWISEEIIFHD